MDQGLFAAKEMKKIRFFFRTFCERAASAAEATGGESSLIALLDLEICGVVVQ